MDEKKEVSFKDGSGLDWGCKNERRPARDAPAGSLIFADSPADLAE